jgi:alpha-mannosidase
MTDCPERGPWRAAVRTRRRVNESTFEVKVSVSAGVPRVDFELNVNWLERGTNETGVPTLRVAFPLAIEKPVATFECPNGFVERSTDPNEIPSHTTRLLGRYFKSDMPVDPAPGEVPAQKWADLTGKQSGTKDLVGATLLNDSKYGHAVDGSTLRLTLLRSTSDPDPLSDLGRHVVRLALRPHVGAWTPGDSARAGFAFNMPLSVIATRNADRNVGATVQKGKLPARQGLVELLTPNVCLSGMKKAEDSGALVVRLYETEGKGVTAKLRLDESLVDHEADAVECDVHEQPVRKNTAKFAKGVLSVEIPAFGMTTVRIG